MKRKILLILTTLFLMVSASGCAIVWDRQGHWHHDYPYNGSVHRW